MKKIYYLYNVIFLFLTSNIIAQPNKDSINEVVELIDKVINWQNQQTDHIKKYTLTNWQFATNYIGMMKAFKTTGNIAYQNYLKIKHQSGLCVKQDGICLSIKELEKEKKIF